MNAYDANNSPIAHGLLSRATPEQEAALTRKGEQPWERNVRLFRLALKDPKRVIRMFAAVQRKQA